MVKILHFKQGGFTVIELLVVVSIIVIFPAIVIANFPQIRLQFALSRVAHTFAQEVRRTQDLSIASMQYRDSFGNIQAISGYGVSIDISAMGNKKYIIYADSKPGNKQHDVTDYTVKSVDFSADEPGIIIKEINYVLGSSVSVNFTPPDPQVTITQLDSGQTAVNVVFALESDLQNTKMVSVNTAGLVEIK